MFELARTVLGLKGKEVYLVPCTVTSVTPLLVTINGTSMPGVKVAGCTYSTGPANAMWAPPSTPVILPIGA